LWEVNDLFSYWRDHPPLHVLLGACLLKQPAPSASSPDSARSQVSELKTTVAALGGSVSKRLPAVYRTHNASSYQTTSETGL
jgi:hypothetical protein